MASAPSDHHTARARPQTSRSHDRTPTLQRPWVTGGPSGVFLSCRLLLPRRLLQTRRRHSRLGNLSPTDYETMHLTQNEVSAWGSLHECSINRHQQHRGFATRYDKLAVRYTPPCRAPTS